MKLAGYWLLFSIFVLVAGIWLHHDGGTRLWDGKVTSDYGHDRP